MAYNIFSQPSGPRIDATLFPSVAQSGLTTGKSIGTPLSNAIEGGIKGYQQGQQIYSEAQQQEIRQNQIDQFPITNERQRLALDLDKEQLQNAQQVNQLNKIKLEQAKELEALNTNAERIQTQNDLEKNQFEINLRKKEQELQERLTKATPKDLVNIALSGQYADVFSRNTPLLKQFSGRLNSFPDGMVSADIKKAFLLQSGLADVDDFVDKEAAKNLTAFNEAQSQYSQSKLQQRLSRQLGVTPDKLASSVLLETTGKYETDLDGNVLRDKYGKPKLSSIFNPKEAGNRVDVFTLDENKQPLKRVATNEDGEQQKIFDAYSSKRELYTGEFRSKAQKEYVDNFNKQFQTKTAPIVSQQPVVQTTAEKTDPVAQKVLSSFSLNPEKAQNLTPLLKSYSEFLKELPSISPRNISLTVNNPREVLVRALLDEQFEQLNLEKTIPDTAVEKYNAGILGSSPYSGTSTYTEAMKPWLISNKKDLHFQTNRNKVESILDAIEREVLTNGRLKEAAPALKQAGIRGARGSFTSAIAGK